MILWADIFQVRKGDKLLLSIDGPQGSKILRYETVIKKNRTRHFVYAGKPLKTSRWPSGDYRGKVSLIRKKNGQGPERLTEVRTISIPGGALKKKVRAVSKPAIAAIPVVPVTRATLDQAVAPPTTVPETVADMTDNSEETLLNAVTEVSQIWKPKDGKWRWIWLAIAVGGAVFIIIYNANEERKQGGQNTRSSGAAKDEGDVGGA